jgi:hypothetical protein
MLRCIWLGNGLFKWLLVLFLYVNLYSLSLSRSLLRTGGRICRSGAEAWEAICCVVISRCYKRTARSAYQINLPIILIFYTNARQLVSLNSPKAPFFPADRRVVLSISLVYLA